MAPAEGGTLKKRERERERQTEGEGDQGEEKKGQTEERGRACW